MIKFHAQYADYMNELQLLIVDEIKDRVYAAEPIIFKDITEAWNNGGHTEPTLRLEPVQATQLLTSLINAGVVIPEKYQSKVDVQAKDEHIADLKSFGFRLLTLVEKNQASEGKD